MILKFGKFEHIKELYENGTVYMQRAENYTNLDHSEQGDKNENLTYLYQSSGIKSLKIDGQEIECVGNVKLKVSKRQNPFIFSTYALMENKFINGKNTISKKCLKFGDTVLLITDLDKFFQLFKNSLDKSDNFYSGLVEYIDEENYHGDMGIMKKLKEYKHQHECRIVVESNLYQNSKSITLSLGSLKDCSQMFSSKVLLDTLRIE